MIPKGESDFAALAIGAMATLLLQEDARLYGLQPPHNTVSPAVQTPV